MRVTSLGDLVLDVIVQLEDELVPGDASARFVGKRGGDVAGELVARELRDRGVEVCGPLGERTGVVVSIAASDERTMASDRGSAPELTAAELEPAWFDCDMLHLSGYSLQREPIAVASARAAEVARARGARVSVDLSTWTGIDDAFRERIRSLEPDVVFAGQRERDVFGELDTSWVVKRGAEGVIVDGRAFPALAVDVVDTTGAGDAFAAGFLVGGVALGLEAAARCCSQLGAMP